MSSTRQPRVGAHRQAWIFGRCLTAALQLVAALALSWPSYASAQASANAIPARIQAAAKELKVVKIQVAMATIKSIEIQGGRIDYEFTDSPLIGSMHTNKLSFQLNKPDPLLTVPRDTKKVRIYWGQSPDDNGTVIAIQKAQ